jgi:sulfatase maturation enzyme AslB (radical SAM superfamily)
LISNAKLFLAKIIFIAMEPEIVQMSSSSDENTENINVVASSSSSSMSKKTNKGSEAWRHFIKDPDYEKNKKALCKYCHRQFVCSGGSTTNLHTHIKKFHNMKAQQVIHEENVSLLDLFANTKVKYIYYL